MSFYCSIPSGEYGVEFQIVDRRGRIVNRRWCGTTVEERDAHAKRIEARDNFVKFTAWLDPADDAAE